MSNLDSFVEFYEHFFLKEKLSEIEMKEKELLKQLNPTMFEIIKNEAEKRRPLKLFATKEVMDKYHQEMAYLSILKKAVGEKYGDIVAKIKEESDLSEFFAEAKLDSKKLEKLVGKNAGKIIDILKSEKQKKAVIKKEIILKSESPDGVHMIKKTLGSGFNAEIFYIGSGKYSIKTEAQEMKKADAKLREILGEIEKMARENKMIFSIREK